MSDLRVSTSGEQSSMRKTFFPVSERRAGSMKMMSGLNSVRISCILSLAGSILRFETVMFSALSDLKLCFAAMQRDSCISLYSTCDAYFEKYQLSTPRPPVRSAILNPSPPISDANRALYVAVAELLHCSADRRAGKISSGRQYQS